MPALFVVEHVASSDFLQTLISHLKVIDSVADDTRVAPVKANCLFLIFKMVINDWFYLFMDQLMDRSIEKGAILFMKIS